MNQPSRLRGRRCPLMGAPTKELEGIGVSAARDSPSIDTETLLAASYGIITGADNSVTTVTTGARQQSSPASSGRFSPEVRPTSRGLRQMPRDKGSLRSSKGIPAPPPPPSLASLGERAKVAPRWSSMLHCRGLYIDAALTFVALGNPSCTARPGHTYIMAPSADARRPSRLPRSSRGALWKLAMRDFSTTRRADQSRD
jgi:hypothetical protein